MKKKQCETILLNYLFNNLRIYFLFSFCVSSSFSMLWMWMSELMPTTVRNAGVGSASMIARVGGVSLSTKCTVLPDHSEECWGGISLHDCPSWRGEFIHKMHSAP